MPYNETTEGIRVEVEPAYLPAESNPGAGRFVFSYTITLVNESTEEVQLLDRHWHIQHGDGRQEEVKGPGVVGEQPRLAPRERYRYTSGCVLSTPHGTMHGSYGMVRRDGSRFDVIIPAFSLAAPHALN